MGVFTFLALIDDLKTVELLAVAVFTLEEVIFFKCKLLAKVNSLSAPVDAMVGALFGVSVVLAKNICDEPGDDESDEQNELTDEDVDANTLQAKLFSK